MALLVVAVAGCRSAPQADTQVHDGHSMADFGSRAYIEFSRGMKNALERRDRGDQQGCAAKLEALALQFPERPDAAYAAVTCRVEAGEVDAAFQDLFLAIKQGFRDDWVKEDPDLVPLHRDPRWDAAVTAIAENEKRFRARVNLELLKLAEDDQKERQPPIDWVRLRANDAQRLQRVLALVKIGLREPDDLYNAALILQHGDKLEHFRLAHDLCMKALQIRPLDTEVRWLTAASLDRWLQSKGRPQHFGTQIRLEGGQWTAEPLEHSVSDEERAGWAVSPIADAIERAAKQTDLQKTPPNSR
jgi:hypothetical protein